MSFLRNIFRVGDKTATPAKSTHNASRDNTSGNVPMMTYYDLDGEVKTLRVKSGVVTMSDGPGAWRSLGKRKSGLSRTDYGMALAMTASVWGYRCVNIISDILGRLPRQVVEKGTAGEVEDSNLIRAFDRAFLYHGHDIMALWTMSRQIQGEAYIHKAVNEFEFPANVYWLNPLAMRKDVINGQIQAFVYSGADAPMVQYQPNEILYHRRLHPVDDLSGLSPMEVALSSINVDLAMKTFIQAFFRNNARPGLIISPAGGQTFTQGDEERIKEWVKEDFVGVDKAGKPMFLPKSATVSTAQPPDLDHQMETLERVANEVCAAFGVPKGLISQDNTRFQISPQTEVWFYRNTIIPEATAIERAVNAVLIPFFDRSGGTEFKFVTAGITPLTEDDERKERIAAQRLATGAISMNEYRKEIGLEELDTGNVHFLPTGSVPVSVNTIGGNGGQSAPGEVVGTKEDASTQIFGYHMELGIVTRNEARARLGLEPLPDPEGKESIELKEQLSLVQQAVAAGIPLETALQMAELDIELPEAEPATIPQPKPEEAPAKQADPLDELRAWERKVKNNGAGKAFECHVISEPLAELITGQLTLVDPEDKPAIKAIFQHARYRLEEKAIQATRLDFEADFEDLLAAARGADIDRRTFSLRLRTILRKYGGRAYRDGLRDGGIEIGADEKLDDEDRATVNTLTAGQSTHVTEIGRVLFKGDGISDAQAQNKLTMWFNGSIRPFYDAGLLSADKNGLYEDALGSTEEHCDDCLRLDGQRHRLRHWAGRNLIMGTVGQDTECEGWKCECKLVRTRGRARGKF